MTDWQHQFPSTSVTRTYKGDQNLGRQYDADGTKLLYELKNQMTFNNLGQLKMTRLFTDGTVITCWSHFGYDHIDVDVTKKVEGEISCSITLVDMPDTVSPMRYPGEIHAGEVEGTDYYKTYYTFDISNCVSCTDPANFTMTFEFTDDTIAHHGSELSNHCIYSIDGGCWGEIIEQDSDVDGTYIIWKAYTEASDYTRSGYGYLSMRVNLTDTISGDIICDTSQTILVDCCEKADLAIPKVYWQCGIWTTCDSPEIDGLGEVPNEISYLTLSDCIAGAGTCTFYALPEVGGCLPYTWTLTGPGTLSVSELGTYAIYQGDSEYDGCADYTISVADRCAGSDTITVSCCDYTTSVNITYTTLQMSCSQSQTVYVEGGCAPYTWSLSGGGSLEPVPSGLSALYTAPSTNAGCSSNPTITVSDCCGYSDSIKIAVNCYTSNYFSFARYDWTEAGSCAGGQPQSVMKSYSLNRGSYDCDGSLFFYNPGVSSLCVCSNDVPDHGGSICSTGASAEGECADMGIYGKCYLADGLGNWGCDGLHTFAVEGQTYDCRTAETIAAGCCPLNPYTGSPW